REALLLFPPHQHRARLRISDDVKAVLRAVVDDDVEVERLGDPSAVALDDEDAGQWEAFRLEPLLTLHLCGVAGRRRTFRQKDDFPAMGGGELGETRKRTRFDLLQVLPEIFDRLDVP